ncbi:MAG: DUF3788 family protein [Bacteroidales bacterium]|nr:DUF3788 family protein [Bacteroidales bacterium]
MKNKENISRQTSGKPQQTPGNPQQMLRNPQLVPDATLFQSILSPELYAVINKLGREVTAAGLSLEWRYYNDGKAWLGKTTYKTKTVVWLSVWDQYIKASFYFTEKTGPGISALNIDEKVKSAFAAFRPTGKLLPLSLDIRNEAMLKDFLAVLEYKKNL